MRRRLLGTVSGVLARTRVYLAADAIEVDEIEGYTGTRRRVLLDEILLVTLHRRRRLLTVVIWLVFASVFSFPALAVGRTTAKEAALLAALFLASPFLLGALLHLAFGVDVVTVFGKRGVAQIAFSFRKRRAKEVFALLRERAQEAQDRARGSSAQPRPPAGSTSAA